MAAGASYELINRTVIFALIEAAQRHDHKTLRSMGIDPGSVGQLRNLNLDTVIGSRLSHSLVDIQINQRGLELLFHNSSNKVYREGLIDDAIALGLRHSMLARLVKISRRPDVSTICVGMAASMATVYRPNALTAIRVGGSPSCARTRNCAYWKPSTS